MVSVDNSSKSGTSMKTDGSGPQYFADSTKGNIKEAYHFERKLANGGFGIVYLAEHRQTKQKFAVKAIQKKKLKDYTTFINEINILKVLVSKPLYCKYNYVSMCRIIQTSSSYMRYGSGMKYASWFLSK